MKCKCIRNNFCFIKGEMYDCYISKDIMVSNGSLTYIYNDGNYPHSFSNFFLLIEDYRESQLNKILYE